MIDELVQRFQNHDRQALARLISLVARGEYLPELRKLVHTPTRGSIVIAVTGSAGVGKSTLIGGLVTLLVEKALSVAVFACDPQSPFTGGALLGDRIRIGASNDEGVFIRSLSVPSGRQSVADNLGLMVDLAKAYGFQVVLVETVGSGQGDTSVRAIADVVALLIQPETGDDLQWQKAGILEIADVIVVQKTDLPGANRLEAELREQLGSSRGRGVEILRATASRKEGIAELWQTIESHWRIGDK